MAVVIASIPAVIHNPGSKVVGGRTLVRLLNSTVSSSYDRRTGKFTEARYHEVVAWSEEPPKRNAPKPMPFLVQAGSVELVSIDGPKREVSR